MLIIHTFVCIFKAAQMWILACYLPMLVKKYITTDDYHWKDFCQSAKFTKVFHLE